MQCTCYSISVLNSSTHQCHRQLSRKVIRWWHDDKMFAVRRLSWINCGKKWIESINQGIHPHRSIWAVTCVPETVNYLKKYDGTNVLSGVIPPCPHPMTMSRQKFTFTPDEWVKLWAKGFIGFHFKVVHPVIKEFHPWLSDGKKHQRILLPFCGKSLDMAWLAEQGHQVVGVDCVEQAAKEFFAENDIGFTVADIASIEDGKIYKSADGKIEFYVCDFFKLSRDVIGQFDAVWDMRALFAIPGYDQKIKYIDQLKPFIKSGGRILLDVAEPKLKPDQHVPDWVKSLYEVDVKKMYGWCSTIKLAKTYDYETMKCHLMKDPVSEEKRGLRFDAYGMVYQLVAS